MSLHVIDTLQLGRPGIIAVTALETNDGVALFDAGPESTFNNVVRGLESVGIKRADVRHVFLSHIHFDHSGAAFRLAESGATIYVHPRGAPHLIDPTRLIESATRIFGNDMPRLWGRIGAVPESRLRILNNQDVVSLGAISVQAIETPGHASHHHVYFWDETIFGGDVAGVRLGKGPPIPPFVPPELNVEQWIESITRIRALGARVLYLPHFGAVRHDIPGHLDAVSKRVHRWSEWFRDRIRSGEEEAHLISQFANLEHEELGREGADEAGIEDYEMADPSRMAVPASVRYWTKYHPEQVTS